MVILSTERLRYEQVYTDALWDAAVDHRGTAFESVLLSQVHDFMIELRTMSNMAAEQKARTTYDNLLRLIDDPDVRDPIKYLREREIVHYQRFGEALRVTQDNLDSKNFYAVNPSYDKKKPQKPF